jgi:hypothetical protein
MYRLTPEQEQEQILENKKYRIRKYRDAQLAMCDWTQVPDSPLPAEVKAQWAAYRQYLRDITDHEDFPDTEILIFARWASENEA